MARVRGAVRTRPHRISCGVADGRSGPPTPTSRTVTLVAVGAAAVFAAAAITLGLVGEQLWGGWYWPALVFAAGESTLSVFGPVWLLGIAQRRLNQSFRWPVR